MFKELGNLGYDRNWVQAMGFYIAYMLLIMAIAMVLAIGISRVLPPVEGSFEAGFKLGVQTGAIIAGISCIALSLTILHQKKRSNDILLLLLALFSGGIGFLLGALGGLIPVAFLTTRKKLKK